MTVVDATRVSSNNLDYLCPSLKCLFTKVTSPHIAALEILTQVFDMVSAFRLEKLTDESSQTVIRRTEKLIKSRRWVLSSLHYAGFNELTEAIIREGVPLHEAVQRVNNMRSVIKKITQNETLH
jgi:hypothetical protein